MPRLHPGPTGTSWLPTDSVAPTALLATPAVEPTATPAPSLPIPSFIVDAHQDIAWNWLEFGRLPSDSAIATRSKESAAGVSRLVGQRTTGLPEWLQGRIGIMVGSIFVMPEQYAYAGSLQHVYSTPSEAHARAIEQVHAYWDLADIDPRFRLITSRQDLDQAVAPWTGGFQDAEPGVGIIISMEGADAIEQPAQVADWHAMGVRIVGPAWAATRYSYSNLEHGPLTDLGRELLREMAQLNMILDLSHMSEEASLEAVDSYPCAVIASHSNPARFCTSSRGLSDELVRRLGGRGGVQGIMLYNRFLYPGWTNGDPRSLVTTQTVAEAIDEVAQLTGSSAHVGLGTDLDGGFGLGSIPEGVESAADLPRIADALMTMGYGNDDVEAIFNRNWLRVLGASLPGTEDPVAGHSVPVPSASDSIALSDFAGHMIR